MGFRLLPLFFNEADRCHGLTSAVFTKNGGYSFCPSSNHSITHSSLSVDILAIEFNELPVRHTKYKSIDFVCPSAFDWHTNYQLFICPPLTACICVYYHLSACVLTTVYRRSGLLFIVSLSSALYVCPHDVCPHRTMANGDGTWHFRTSSGGGSSRIST